MDSKHILNVKDWLSIRNYDFYGLRRHIDALLSSNVSFGNIDVETIAENYGIPKDCIDIKKNEISINIKLKPNVPTKFIQCDF